MMKELIDLQRGSKATCALILDSEYEKLGQGVIMDANIRDSFLFASPYKLPIFKEQLEKKSSLHNLTYFIIRNIDELECDNQNKFVGLIKDREFDGYILPQNVIIVLTIQEKNNISKISSELYHFCVVAI